MKTINTNKKFLFFLILILVGIAGFVLIIITSSQAGAGLTPDSVAYIAAARNILNNNGVTVLYNSDGTVPLNLWAPMNPDEIKHVILTPPLFPFFLAFTGIFGLDILEGARYLNAFLFGLNIYLFGFLIKRMTGSSLFSILASLFFFVSTNVIFVHHNVWSEPLFITFFIVGSLFLIEYLVDLQNKRLYLSAFFYSLAILTRYAAIILVIIGVLVILFFNNEKINKRIIKSSVFVLISCFPLVIWYARLKLLDSGSSIRRLIFYPINIKEIQMMMDNITKWVLPGRIPLNTRVIIFGILIVVFLIIALLINNKIKNRKNIYNSNLNKSKSLVKATEFFLITIGVYVLAYILIRYILDANFDFYDNRHLIPIFMSLFILIILSSKIFINLINKIKFKRLVLSVISVLFFIFIGFYAYYFYQDPGNIHRFPSLRSGIGYSRPDWRRSETIDELKKFSEDTVIYTNEPNAVYILANRASYMIPVKIDIYSRDLNNKYELQIQDMVKELKQNKGILVMFKTGLGFLPTENELKNQIQLDILRSYSDGTIYKIY